jgi:hypothetical protein
MMPDSPLLSALATSVLAGEPGIDGIIARASRTLGRDWHWVPPLAQRYVQKFSDGTRPRRREVVRFLLQDRGFQRAWLKHFHQLSVEQWLAGPQQMQPVAAARTWDIPAIESAGDLAAWLGLDPGELDWFADLKGLGYKKSHPQLRHYHYRILSKQSGAVRLIEAPKPRLKELQRHILAGILEKIPAHRAVHGFLKGHSIQTFIAPHVGQRVAGWRALRNRLARSIRAMRTILRFPAAKSSSGAWSGFRLMRPPFCSKRASPCITARRASCARACGNTWWGSSRMNA